VGGVIFTRRRRELASGVLEACRYGRWSERAKWWVGEQWGGSGGHGGRGHKAYNTGWCRIINTEEGGRAGAVVGGEGGGVLCGGGGGVGIERSAKGKGRWEGKRCWEGEDGWERNHSGRGKER